MLLVSAGTATCSTEESKDPKSLTRFQNRLIIIIIIIIIVKTELLIWFMFFDEPSIRYTRLVWY
jgi:hypothetical protein